jgi:hypothetical protein
VRADVYTVIGNEKRYENMSEEWSVKELTRDNIEAIAQQLGIPVKRINDDIISDIVHSVRKGVDAALENWGEIVREAIRQSVPDEAPEEGGS